MLDIIFLPHKIKISSSFAVKRTDLRKKENVEKL